MRVLAIILIGLVSSACTSSPDPESSDAAWRSSDPMLGAAIAAYFQPFVDNRDFSGAVRVERGGELVFEGAWGIIDLATQAPVTAHTRFGIASVTKTFTAHALVLLRDRGLVDFEAPLSTYFPEFKHGDTIKVKHLIRFESGLPQFPNLVGANVDIDRADGMDILGDGELLFEPGEGDAYSNEGFFVIARLVEEISAQPFEDFVRDEFLTPLGLADTGDRARPAFDDAELALPHLPGPPPAMLRPGTGGNPSQSLGSGSMYSTAEDLARWGLAVARDRFVDLDGEYWPWGWGKADIGGRAGLEQTGSNEGYVSSLTVYPDEELVIAILSNVDYGLWMEWGRDVARILDGTETVLAPTPYHVANSVPADVRSTAVGRYTFEDRFVDIRDLDGELYLYLNAWPVGRHLLALSDGRFQLRDFTGVITFNGDADGDRGADSLTWEQPAHWSADPQVYERR